MAGTPISHTTLVPGATVSASTLNDNFEAINTYLTNTKLANQYIANPVHNWSMSWHMDSLAVGTGIIYFAVPSSLTGGITAKEVQLWVEDNGTNGTVNVNIHTSNTPSSGNQILANDLTVNADKATDSDTSFTHNSFGGVFTSGVWIQYEVTTNSVSGVTINLFGVANNRS